MAKFCLLYDYNLCMPWERIGEKTLSTILHNSWESGRVNLIFLPNLAWDVS